ncbi:hypothetical protein L6452_32300 [Arctium lappa]|uniref:Uncharacterized protein n=1 Tax=Arctium lappa TaxID=4217 RepID=A0ACB8Z5F9_ARCLA|nr:hypothetical protein L6452_32300 [Arctium lappa]
MNPISSIILDTTDENGILGTGNDVLDVVVMDIDDKRGNGGLVYDGTFKEFGGKYWEKNGLATFTEVDDVLCTRFLFCSIDRAIYWRPTSVMLTFE